jgi:hypothetical protein
VTRHVFLPAFRAFGRRHRVRLRLARPWLGRWLRTDDHGGGRVVRTVKAGPLLAVAMSDEG